MPERSLVFEEKLKQKGFFNYPELYNFCFNWLKDEKFNVEEREYTEKVSAGGKEIVIKWVAWTKVSDYFKNEVEVKWHILGLNDAEVEVNGKKEKTNKGEVKLTIKGELVRDYESRWEDNPFYKFFRGVYDKYIIKTTTDYYEDKLTAKVVDFVDQIKSFLVLELKR